MYVCSLELLQWTNILFYFPDLINHPIT